MIPADTQDFGCCWEIERLIEARLDDPPDPARDEMVDTHLAACSACRDYRDGLAEACAAVAELEEIPFPADALAVVMQKTVARRRSRLIVTRPGRRFAAAATIVFVLFASIFSKTIRDQSAANRELEFAARQADLALRLTADALHRINRLAVGDVLGNRVSDAVRRIPVQWKYVPNSPERSPKS